MTCLEQPADERQLVERCEYAVTLALRDALRSGLLVREGEVLTMGLVEERAANLAVRLAEEFTFTKREG